MRIKVMKFGGSSVNSNEKRQLIARKVTEAKQNGFAPIVVVSAMGRDGEPYATDTLLKLVGNATISDADRAILASCGEIISSVVMSATLVHAGMQARALSGAQAGINVVNGCIDGRISLVNPRFLLSWIERGVVPVVAGFQGSLATGEPAVLSRGGSDVSAAAIGTFVGAELVEIYTDVRGVMTADPRVCQNAKVIARLSYDEAYTMAKLGAKVIHPEAVKWARLGDIPLHIGTISDSQLGTKVYNFHQEANHYPAVFSSLHNAETVTIGVCGQSSSHIYKAFELLQNFHVPFTKIEQENNWVCFNVPREDAKHVINFIHDALLNNFVTQRAAI